MITQFRTLFTVSVSHAYYQDSVCGDFVFIVPADAARLMANRKLHAKIRDGKLYMMFEADESNAALVSAAGVTMHIGLRLLNPFFSNFTKLDFEPTSVGLLYGNSAAPGALDAPSQVVLIGQLFSHSPTKATRPVTTTLKDPDGHSLQRDTITDAADQGISYDLTGKSAGLYTVEETYSGSAVSTRYYFAPEFAALGIFGVVEVKIDSSFYAGAVDFKIPFEAKQEILKYYIVAKSYSDPELDQLSITDAGFGDDARPQVKFTKVLPAAFTGDDIPVALLADGGSKVALFRSEEIVPRQEKSRKKIQLNKNGDVLIKHLPQSGGRTPNSDLIIRISKA